MTHVISLGAGVQSSTMALMAAAGEIEPMPVAAIFADTQNEPAKVYDWLDWLEGELPFPVHRVTAGNLATASSTVRTSAKGNKYTKASIPAFIVDDNGEVGLLMRQCTNDFKIAVIQRELRRIVGRNGRVTQWIGISLDEAHRMKDARRAWITNRWPLIEKRMSRADCLRWMRDHDFPVPPRSSCTFCPYHSNDEWRAMKTERPEEFASVVAYEKEFQAAVKQTGMRGRAFLHRTVVPLDQVDFAGESDAQLNLFGNECEGVCGV